MCVISTHILLRQTSKHTTSKTINITKTPLSLEGSLYQRLDSRILNFSELSHSVGLWVRLSVNAGCSVNSQSFNNWPLLSAAAVPATSVNMESRFSYPPPPSPSHRDLITNKITEKPNYWSSVSLQPTWAEVWGTQVFEGSITISMSRL